MSTRARDESGFALISVLLLLLAMLALGMAVLARSDPQQRLSAQERSREASFRLAEAALNAQALQLSRAWPTTPTVPTSCGPTSISSLCPQQSVIAGGYSGGDYQSTCPSAPGTPAWTTSVRDNAAGERYWTTAVSSRSAYDLNGDGAVWVRSTASVQCERVSVVSIVSRLTSPMDFPANVISANWFGTTNQGRKVMVDTLGAYAQPPSVRPTNSASQPAPVVVRCANLSDAACLTYASSKGQVQPPAVQINRTASSSTLTPAQRQALERQASAAGTLWTTCPSGSSSLSSVGGAPVYVKGPCNISLSGGTTVNSAANPGVLVIERGTLTMSGSSVIYGIVYMANAQGATGAVVSINGAATIQGAVAVDGLGGISVGSSGTGIVYDPRAAALLRGDSGAATNKNTFRVLPSQTP
jgi:Tfp pilus assembly protein PilX